MMYAVVTGGTRGIGLSVCRLLGEAGYSVTALYSSDEECAKKAKLFLPFVNYVRADVGSEEDVKRVFDSLPFVNVLVNNAGVAHFAQVQDVTLEEWEAVMRVNAGGTFLCTKHAIPKMLGRGGTIVNVASVWGETGGSCESVYSAAKGAVIAFTKAVARELAPSHITVNCVSPGAINTVMNARLTQEEVKALCEEIPLGRMGTAEEVAQAVLFLVRSKYITGHVLSVNGGFYM